jgi:hypothetical protein
MRIWMARLLAVVALVGTAVAVFVAISSVDSTSELTDDEAQGAMVRLATANRTISGRLNELAPGTSPRGAQEAVRSAAALTQQLGTDLGGEGGLANRLEDVLAAETAYLDALGSTLNNPNSALRGRVGERGNALREALQNIPGGDPKAVEGGAELVIYSEARAEE